MNIRRQLTAGGVVILLLFLLEVAVRQFLPYNATFEERLMASLRYTPSGVTRQNLDKGQVMYAFDTDGRLNRDSVVYRINRFGYRGSDWRIDSAAVRIAILGGSHVFDINERDGTRGKSWPEQIAVELRKRGANVQVFNLGIPGDATPEILARTLYDLPQLSPKFVILNSIWNDLKWVSTYAGPLSSLQPGATRPNPFVDKMNLLDELIGWSAVYRKVRDAYYRWKYDLKDTHGPLENLSPASDSVANANVASGFFQYEINLKAFVHIVRAIGAVPILAVEERMVAADNTEEMRRTIRYDFISPTMNHAKLVRLFESADSIIVRVGRELGVTVVNVNPLLRPKQASYFADHVHTTREGSRMLAYLYAEALSPLVSARKNHIGDHQPDLTKRKK